MRQTLFYLASFVLGLPCFSILSMLPLSGEYFGPGRLFSHGVALSILFGIASAITARILLGAIRAWSLALAGAVYYLCMVLAFAVACGPLGNVAQFVMLGDPGQLSLETLAAWALLFGLTVIFGVPIGLVGVPYAIMSVALLRRLLPREAGVTEPPRVPTW